MALRSSTPPSPVITGVHPRGRPGMAAVGLVLLCGGLVALGLAAQGALPLAAVSVPSIGVGNPPAPTAAPGIVPNGTAPPSFTAYSDPARQFALYISSSWSGKAGSIAVNGQPQAATVFTPTTAAQPSWRIAFLSSAFPSTSTAYINALAKIIVAEGGKNVTPVQGPAPEQDGLYTWSRLDVLAQLQGGLQAHVVAYTMTLPSGKSVLIVAESQTITYNATAQQDFMPMMNSLSIKA
jgi:hypothetical protein